MRILFTGSGGRLGRLLYAARQHAEQMDDDVIFQSRSPGCDVTWRPGGDLSILPTCDALVALWGMTTGNETELAQNRALVALTRDVALHCGAKRVFHMSSAAVYGPGKAMAETTPPHAVNAYGASKLAMERRVSEAPVDGMIETCLRLANVVGADSLTRGLTGDQPITLDQFEDGFGPVRSYIGASDLLAMFCALARCDAHLLPSLLNIAAPLPVAMQALAEAAGKHVVWRPAPPTAVQDVTLDVSRMTRLLPAMRVASEADAMIADWRRLRGTT